VAAVTAGAARGAPRRAARWAVAVAASLVCAALVLRGASPTEIAARLAALPPRAAASAVGWLALSGAFRARRLQKLLPPGPTLRQSYALHQIHNLVTAVAPPGAGELAAAWLIRRVAGLSLPATATALLLGRALDLGALLALFVAVLATRQVELVAGAPALGTAAAALAFGLTALGAAHVAFPERLPGWLDALARRIESSARPRAAVQRALASGAAALRALPRGAGVISLLLLTLATQLTSLRALEVLLDGAGVPATLAYATAAFVVYVLLRLLPVQGIAGVGTSAAWWAVALGLLGVQAEEAAAVGALLYVAFLAILVLLCLTALPLAWGSPPVREPR
jgi:hypothetical protein